MAPAQQKIIDDVAILTKERLAGRAAKYDQEALNPTENWHDLWEQGFLAMCIPKDHGGMGKRRVGPYRMHPCFFCESLWDARGREHFV